MLKIPSYRYFPDERVTAYQDDVMWWKFYLIPDYVSIRHDTNGDPVFLLIKYAFSDEDRAKNASLPTGGGFMVFDVELRAKEEDITKITAVLQDDVNNIWNQLKALAEQAGAGAQGYSLNAWYYLQGNDDKPLSANTSLGVSDLLLGLDPTGPQAPPGDRPPTVVLDMPTWTDGTFSVSAPQSEALVSHRVAAGKVSLVGNNVASANMDLTDAGATFMQKTLLDTTGGGAVDLTPIQVTYELHFWARVPPVHILVQADSRALYEGVKTVAHTYEDNDCDEDVMKHAEQQMSMAVQSGLVKIQIDPGVLPLTDSFLQQLTTSAQNFVMDEIKDNFFTKQQAPPPADDDPTKDFVNADHDIYYLKQELDFTSIHIGYDETVAAVQVWPANPQGTLQAFFAGLSAQKMKQFVRVVDLEDPFFQTLNLTATAFAPWDKNIDFVEVQFRYHGRDENNQPEEKVQAFTFTKDHTTDKWDPRLIDGKREYEYQWRVGYTGHGTGDWSGWVKETAPQLNIDVGNPGHIELPVAVGNVNFGDVTASVQVDLSYADTAHGVAEQSTTLILGQAPLQQTYDRWLFTPQVNPIRYRTRFFLKTGQEVESDWDTTTSSPLVINEPSSIDKLEVNVFPVGDGWSAVQQAIVDLRHGQDGSTLQLKSLDEFRKWVVVLDNPTDTAFEYKYVASFKDGSPAYEVDWTPAKGDQSLPVPVPTSPTLTVELWPQLVDFTITPLVEASLHYDDDAANVHASETYVFKQDTGNQTWGPVHLHDATKREYRCQLTYHQAHGQVALPETRTDSDKVIMEALDVPRVTCLVSPTIVDFSVTPVVEVNVDYHDPANHVDFTQTLVFTDPTPQPFSFQVADAGSKAYQVTVTYYLADGTVVARDPVTLEKTAITVPKYLAAV
jgi:hypothetical protein